MSDIDIFSPYNNKLIGSVKSFSSMDINHSINCLKSYNFNLSGFDRFKILIKASQMLKKQEKQFAKMIVDEIGVSIKDAYHEVDRTVNVLVLSAEESKRVIGAVYPSEVSDGFDDNVVYSIREPLGIVLCITPFNHPLNQVSHKICPAIAANNAVLLKPSIKCPLTAYNLVQLLYRSGLPKEMLQIVTGIDKNISKSLLTNNSISMISFTGSVQAGTTISNTCGLKKISLELGGNDALVVDNCANIEDATMIAIKGSFGNSGQRCSAIKRIITLPTIHNQFVQNFVNKTKELNVGNPYELDTDIGTVIDEDYAKEIERRIKDAVKMGADMLCGGNRFNAQLEPTVLDNITMNMEIVKKETFGPVAPIIRSKNFEHALEIMNDTTFGLNAGIVTNNLSNLKRFIKKAKVGGIRINMPTSQRNEVLPFGGMNDSGYGRGGIISAIKEMTNIKTIIG